MKKVLAVLVEDWWLKLLSVGVAAVIWVLISQRSFVERQVKNVPIVLTAPEGKFILTQKRPKMWLELKGPMPMMNRLREGSLKAEIDIEAKLEGNLPNTALTPQALSLPIVKSDVVGLPRDVDVRDFGPEAVSIWLDEIYTKTDVTVVIDAKRDLKGTPRKGFEVGKVLPGKRVNVTGPKSIVKGMTRIGLSQPIDVTGQGGKTLVRERRVDTRVRIADRPAGGANRKAAGMLVDCLKVMPPSIEVHVYFEAKRLRKTFTDVAIKQFGDQEYGYTVLLGDKTKELRRLAAVEVEGRPDLLETYQPLAFVDLTDVEDPKKTSQVKRTVQFRETPGVRIVRIAPEPGKPGAETLEVVVRIKPEKPE